MQSELANKGLCLAFGYLLRGAVQWPLTHGTCARTEGQWLFLFCKAGQVFSIETIQAVVSCPDPYVS
jgi:hypothetical protein